MDAQRPPCLIGMEACSGAHHWARLFQGYGHTFRLMAPKFVTPYRMRGKRGKNDAADTAAICEAVTRPHIRFIPIKDMQQQPILCLHRTRQGHQGGQQNESRLHQVMASRAGLSCALHQSEIKY